MELTKSAESALIATLSKHFPQAQAFYLYGSYARGDAWPSSDIDLAVLLPVPVAFGTNAIRMSDCVRELCAISGKEVELINVRDADPLLQTEIVYRGRRIAVYDSPATELFEIRILKDFQKLYEEQAPIIADGLRTGNFRRV